MEADITLTACGSNFVSASAPTTESAQFGVRSHTADACDQTIWTHAPESGVCTGAYWWPGSSSGARSVGRIMCPTRTRTREITVGHMLPKDEADALCPPSSLPDTRAPPIAEPLPRARVPRGLQTHVKLCALLG